MSKSIHWSQRYLILCISISALLAGCRAAGQNRSETPAQLKPGRTAILKPPDFSTQHPAPSAVPPDSYIPAISTTQAPDITSIPSAVSRLDGSDETSLPTPASLGPGWILLEPETTAEPPIRSYVCPWIDLAKPFRHIHSERSRNIRTIRAPTLRVWSLKMIFYMKALACAENPRCALSTWKTAGCFR